MKPLGQWGEDLVVQHLRSAGWTIIKRNFRTPFGEIDIVGWEPRGILVFVEVKTLRLWDGGLMPEDNMTPGKGERFRRIAGFYANRNPQLVPRGGWRLDLITVSILTEDYKDFEIKTYENVLGGDS